ncbi:MAG: hypothetical protein AAF208_10310 [Cyanobacteria bacterium P01_A01_bin.45]
MKFLKFALCLAMGILFSIVIAVYLSADGKSINNYVTSWIGNSFGGGDKWVQIQISGMYVAPDGSIYTNSPWDEATREAGIYKNGDVIGKAEDLHGWGRLGGIAVTADTKYIYVAMQQSPGGKPGEDYPPKGTNWYCVRRYELSGKQAPFPGGRGWDKSMLIVSQKSQVTGLATIGDELYVSDSGDNLVRVYDTTSMEQKRSFAVENPGKIATHQPEKETDKQASLWIIQNSSSNTASGKGKVVHYSKEGKQLPQIISDVENPSAIAIDNRHRLMVADNGKRQQILIYDLKNQPKLVKTLGVRGGIYAGVPGEVKADKFAGISGVGMDKAGNIYVANDGFNRSGVDLRQISADGKLQHQLLGLQFLDNADADPVNDAADVYTKNERFRMDYSKAPGKEWTYQGYTLNAFKYPQDPRLHTPPDAPFVRHFQGKTFLYLTDMYGGMFQIYRFDRAKDGEIAVPSGMFVGTNADGGERFKEKWPPFQPQVGEWIWRDRNGNGGFDSGEYDSSKDNPYIGGWWVDSKGDVWKTLRTKDGVGIRHYPLQGLDSQGNPVYSYSTMKKIATPQMFTDLRRIEYFPESDIMYLSGFTKENPPINGDYAKLVGSEIIRFDNWSKGNSKPRWRIVFPVDRNSPPEVLTPQAISVEKDYVFAVTVKKAEVYVYDAKTGKQLKKIVPGPEVSGESGWVDIPYGIRAFRRKNGEYLVFVEENSKAKVLMYRFKG